MRNRPASQLSDTTSWKARSVVLQQPLRHRHALLRIGIEQRRIRAALDDQRQLPRQIVGVLQSGVHALRADRAVDMRRIAEQEAAPGAEALGGAMMDAIGRKPRAALEIEIGARLVAQGWDHRLEGHVPSRSSGGRMPTTRQ